MKKVSVCIIIILYLLVSVLSVYAEESYNIEDYLDIINPKIEDDYVEVKDKLFISMNIKKEADLYLSVKKEIKVLDDEYINSIIKGNLTIEKFVDEVLFDILFLSDDAGLGREKVIKLVSDYTDLKKEKESLKKEKNVLDQEFFRRKKQVEDIEDLEDLIENKKLLDKKYKEVNKKYNKAYDEYKELFKIVLLDKDPIKSDDIIPYYEKKLENVLPGNYEMIITLNIDDEEYRLSKRTFDIGVNGKKIDGLLDDYKMEYLNPIDKVILED